MALLINAQNVSKTFGATPLFRDLSLQISEGERLGLIGPNGSGKSTLLQILSGRLEPDAGEISFCKNTSVAFVAQESTFAPGLNIQQVMTNALNAAAVSSDEQAARAGETLGRAGFTNFEEEAAALSGGWRKRLAIAEALVIDPDVLLLDEPTNHLDLAGISWLEKLLGNASFAAVTISHDRRFLENIATDVAELNRVYPDGLLQIHGAYSTFLEKKDDLLQAQQKQGEALANRVRTEVEWLRRGPKARTTKSKARIDKANELIGELKDLRTRSRTGSVQIELNASDRKTKRLLELEDVRFSYETKPIVNDLSFTFTAGTRLGLVGPNGSGKTTLLRLLRGELHPDSGEVRQADNLRLVYFDQNRPLDSDVTLRRALAPDSDSVVYRDRTIHVATWAARFLFTSEQLNQPVGRLSGGERARVLIARLMLEAADVLLLDEPTNDLDIPTLELLEESLSEFPGALILVTHDRFMLDRVSTLVLGLDGLGNAQTFADYSQWETWQAGQIKGTRNRGGVGEAPPSNDQANSIPTTAVRKKLSYLDSRDMETIEERINGAEIKLLQVRARLEDVTVASSPKLLSETLAAIDAAQANVDQLYSRWAELEAKTS